MNKKHLVVFEDDAVTQGMYIRIFKDEFEIDVFDSFESFQASEKKEKIDLIIMDISLKGKYNGLEITRELRKQDVFKDTIIVCITAHAFQKDIVNALQAGVTTVLVKPVHKNKLESTIGDLFKKKSTG